MTFTLSSTTRLLASSSLLTALLLNAPAFGQQPATPAAPIDVPTMSCTKPSDFMPTFKSTQELARFTKSLDVYKACVNDYVHANSTKANDLAAQARVYNDSANAAITSFNAYMTELNEATQAAGAQSPSNQGGVPKTTP